jgi:hypothetical protein
MNNLLKHKIQMEEIWKDILNYENYYEVSNFGNVRRKLNQTIYKDGRIANFSQTILKPSLHKKGYLLVYLSKNSIKKTKKIHRLVAENFLLNNKNLPQVNHIDCNKLNNHVNNLEWVSNLDNMKHAFKNGIFKNRDLKNTKNG